MNKFKPDYTTGVGSFLKDWLESNDVEAKVFAKKANCPMWYLNKVMDKDLVVNGYFIQMVANFTGAKPQTLTNINYTHNAFLLRK